MTFLISHFGIAICPHVQCFSQLTCRLRCFGVPLEGHYYTITDRAHYMEDMAPENMQRKRFSVKSDV